MKGGVMQEKASARSNKGDKERSERVNKAGEGNGGNPKERRTLAGKGLVKRYMMI
jgi:hypothetical protein